MVMQVYWLADFQLQAVGRSSNPVISILSNENIITADR